MEVLTTDIQGNPSASPHHCFCVDIASHTQSLYYTVVNDDYRRSSRKQWHDYVARAPLGIGAGVRRHRQAPHACTVMATMSAGRRAPRSRITTQSTFPKIQKKNMSFNAFGTLLFPGSAFITAGSPKHRNEFCWGNSCSL